MTLLAAEGTPRSPNPAAPYVLVEIPGGADRYDSYDHVADAWDRGRFGDGPYGGAVSHLGDAVSLREAIAVLAATISGSTTDAGIDDDVEALDGLFSTYILARFDRRLRIGNDGVTMRGDSFPGASVSVATPFGEYFVSRTVRGADDPSVTVLRRNGHVADVARRVPFPAVGAAIAEDMHLSVAGWVEDAEARGLSPAAARRDAACRIYACGEQGHDNCSRYVELTETISDIEANWHTHFAPTGDVAEDFTRGARVCAWQFVGDDGRCWQISVPFFDHMLTVNVERFTLDSTIEGVSVLPHALGRHGIRLSSETGDADDRVVAEGSVRAWTSYREAALRGDGNLCGPHPAELHARLLPYYGQRGLSALVPDSVSGPIAL